MYGLISLPLIAATSLMQYNYASASAAVTEATAAAAAAATASVHDIGAGLDATQLQQPKQRRQQRHSAPAASARQPQPQEQSARSLLRQPAVLLLLWRCLLLGIGMGTMSNYEFLWLKQLGAPETLMGFAIAVSSHMA